MAHKSPFTEEIYRDWEVLAFDHAHPIPQDEKVRLSQILLDKCFQNGRWVVNPMDAGLPTSLAVTFALQQSRWLDAIDLCQQYLGHPELDEKEDWHNLHFFTMRHGLARILAHEEEFGASILINQLNSPNAVRAVTYDLRNNLITTLVNLGIVVPVAEPVRKVALEVLTRVRGPRRRLEAARRAQSNADLLVILYDTYQP